MTTTSLAMDDAAVPDFIDRLGLPGLADIHIHFLPENVLQKVWAYFDAASANYGRSWPIRYRWSESERLDHLRRMGVKKIPALTYPHKAQMAAWLNQWNADMAARHDDVLHCGTFYPEPNAAEYVGDALASGARLFKSHIQVGEFDPNHELLESVWRQLEEAQVPVVIHAGSAPVAGTYTGVELIAQLMKRHPRLVLVIAHMGMPEYQEFAELAERYEGVHLDTTMAFTKFTNSSTPPPPGYIDRLADLGEKVVLGSDFPNIPYSYAEQLRGLADLDLGDDWLRQVLWFNGARLMRFG